MRFVRVLGVAGLVVVSLIGAGCRVSDPRPQDLIPAGFVSDETPDLVNIPYGPRANQTLDIYQPSAPGTGVAIIYLHSGGWSSGDKDSARAHAIPQWLMDQGHIVFSANYTLTTGGVSAFPANLNDVKWAIAWANHPWTKVTYGFHKVVVMGTSAGGHLAALATTSSHARPPDLPADMNVRPDAGMTFSAPLDMTTWGNQAGDPGGWQHVFFQGFWGSGFSNPEEVPLLARVAASPQFFVDPGDPAIFMSSGTGDGLAFPEHNANIVEQRYIDAGPGTYKAWNDIVEGDGHNLGNQNMGAAQLFLTRLAQGQM